MTETIHMREEQTKLVKSLVSKIRDAEDPEQIVHVIEKDLEPIFRGAFVGMTEKRCDCIDLFHFRDKSGYIQMGNYYVYMQDANFQIACRFFCDALASNVVTPPDILFSLKSLLNDSVSLHPMLPIYMDQGDATMSKMVNETIFYAYSEARAYRFLLSPLDFVSDEPPLELIAYLENFLISFGVPPEQAQIPRWTSTRKKGEKPTFSDMKSWKSRLNEWARTSPLVTNEVAGYLLNGPYSSKIFYEKVLRTRWIDVAPEERFAGAAQVAKFLRDVGKITGKPLKTHFLAQIVDSEAP